jgi:hypothetical protein
MVVFVQYHDEMVGIKRFCHVANIPAVFYHGKLKAAEQDAAVRNFTAQGSKFHLFVATIDAAAIGLDLQTAQYALFFTPPTKAFHFFQAAARIPTPRPTQSSCVYIGYPREQLEDMESDKSSKFNVDTTVDEASLECVQINNIYACVP